MTVNWLTMNNSNVTDDITGTLIKTIFITAICEGKSTQPYTLRLNIYIYISIFIKSPAQNTSNQSQKDWPMSYWP